MSSVYLARQPIVSISEKLEAYEIMYLDSNQKATAHNRSASASVIISVLNKFGAKEFSSLHKAFLKVDEQFLMSDLIMTIPNEIFTLCLFQEIELNERVIERVEQLFEKGFTLGVDDIDLNRDNIIKYKKIIDKLDYFKINIYADMGLEDKENASNTPEANLRKAMRIFSKTPTALAAFYRLNKLLLQIDNWHINLEQHNLCRLEN